MQSVSETKKEDFTPAIPGQSLYGRITQDNIMRSVFRLQYILYTFL